MGRHREYDYKKIAEAIRRAGGVMAVAARIVGCDRKTIYNYIENYAFCRKAFEEANETNLDIVEGVLLKQAKAGDPAQVRFYLRTKGKHRGYSDKPAMNLNLDLSTLTDDELRRIAAGEDPAAVLADTRRGSA